MTDPLTLLDGDWITRLRTLPTSTVQCCVTSPPYWGLRDYKLPPTEWPAMSYVPMSGCAAIEVAAWTGCLGLEPTPEMFIAHIVYGFREVRRVLRHDGTLWMNFGDSYATGSGRVGECPGGGAQGEAFKAHFGKHTPGSAPAMNGFTQPNRMPIAGLKPKDLCGIPWRVAFALQADGWYLRSDIIWHKPNPMPESVTDRPTKSHEYLFLLTKESDYFCDMEAIKEGSSNNTHARVPGNVRPPKGQNAYENGDERQRTKAGLLNYAQRKQAEAGSGTKNNGSFDEAMAVMPVTRNSRTVWKARYDIADAAALLEFMNAGVGMGDLWTITTEPFRGAHFATFPSELPRRCILAGTSARGACADCGAPWERTVEQEQHFQSGSGMSGNPIVGKNGHKLQGGGSTGDIRKGPVNSTTTTGWQPTCTCHGHFALAEVVIPARISKEDASALWGADSNGEYLGQSTKGHSANGVQDASAIKQRIIENATTDRTVTRQVYRSDLPLDKHPVRPCTVLDPFGGSGTTGAVAIELGRHAILIELNPEYRLLILQRCNVTPGLALA
jgi:DNA modification methylase